MRRIIAVPVLAVAALALVGCGTSTDTQTIALHYGGGPSENKVFKGCVEPGSTNVGPYMFSGDSAYKIPYGQRDYTFATGASGKPAKGAERTAIVVPAKGGTPMSVSGTVSMELTRDCKKLDALWREVGQRYRVDTENGWLAFLNKYIGGGVEKALGLAAQQFTPDQLYNDPTTYQAMIKAVGENAPTETNRLLGADYFAGPNGSTTFQAIVQKPDPPAALLDQYTNAAVETQARVAAAQKNARLKEEAAGIGTLQKQYGKDYLTVQVIELCKAQPAACQNWLIPPGGNLGAGANVLVQPPRR